MSAHKYPQYQKQVALPVVRLSEDGKIAVVKLDVYDVLEAFGITNPAQAHAVKKILRAGKDHLSFQADMEEVKDSLDRAAQIEEGRASVEYKPAVKSIPDKEMSTFWRAGRTIYQFTSNNRVLSISAKEGALWSGTVQSPSEFMESYGEVVKGVSMEEARKLIEDAGGVW